TRWRIFRLLESPVTRTARSVLERVVRRIERHLRRRGLLPVEQEGADPIGEGDPEGKLAASAVSGPDATGRTAVAGPPFPAGGAAARLRQACVRLARRLHLARGHARGRARPQGSRSAAALRAASPPRAGARRAAQGWPGSCHAQEGLR